jgi:predicted SprT family Zn-dependent metalloprotease
MDIKKAEKLAHALMQEHGLIKEGWQFRWDKAKRRFGQCVYGKRHIKLSRALSAINTEEDVRDTILHEIAHGLTGTGHGHDNVWKAQCIKVGARPERCYDSRKVATIRGSWVATCPGCKHEFTRFKAPQILHSCGYCSHGRFNERFLLAWKRRDRVLPPIIPTVAQVPQRELVKPPTGVIAFNATDAVRLYQAGKRIVDIAVSFGYARGHGQNRVRAALIKAGVYKQTPVDFKGAM